MPLSRDTFQKLIDLFTPHFETLDQRRSLVGAAFFGLEVASKVQLEGTADEFTTRTVQMLIQHGEVEPGIPAIIRLMQQLRGTVGVDKQAEIDTLIDTIRYELASNPAKPTGKPRIFISYSRADGEDFATDLRKRLEAENLTLWQDRDRMEGGVGWWQQITDALDAVEFMVLVATPAAIASAVVKKEWRYARQQGVCVYPVQVPGLPLDFAAMPKWMRDSHFYNLDHEWQTFVNYLKAPCTVPKVPFMAPDLPEHFVQRPEKFDPLKRQLLDADFDNPVAITTALKGAGGFGKTTLAAALCHDEDIQTAFDEGVLWVTLGENPNLINKLTVLYRALTDENPGFIEIEEGANKLAEKLVDADVLLVIDDVWNPAHLRPFLRGGERVARLVTTRFSNIAVDANADLLEVDEMTSDESVQMLLAGIDPPDDLTPFRELADRLGEWALMLEVTNGTLRKRMAKGADLDGALAYVNKALDKRGVAGLKTGSNEAAVQVLDTSIEQIEPDDQPRLFELAIFAEDTDVPLTSIMALWGTDDFDTEELIDQFDDLSFVRFDAERGTIRLHDVVREVLASRLDDPATIHARLVDGWGYPTTLPDEYAWNNIAYHLIESGRADTLRGLLLDYDFLYAKLDAIGVNTLIADCNLLQDDYTVSLIASALRLSGNTLDHDSNALGHQLIGRLMRHRRSNTEVRILTDSIPALAPGLYPLDFDSKHATHVQAGGPLLSVFQHRTGPARGALELSDGSILSWSDDLGAAVDFICRWDPDGNLIVAFENRSGPVSVIELSDGSILSWRNHTMTRWDSQGNLLTAFEDHADNINGVIKLSDGSLLSWSDDTTLRRWDVSGNLLATLRGHSDAVNGAIELSDGSILSWSDDKNDTSLRRWNTQGRLLATLEGHSHAVNGALELSDGSILSWSDDTTLHRWWLDGSSLTTFKGRMKSLQHALELHDGSILSLHWNETEDKSIICRWGPNGSLLATIDEHTEDLMGIKELRDGSILSWNDTNLHRWDPNGSLLSAFEGHTGLVSYAVELGDGSILSCSGSGDNSLRRWDINGTILGVFEGHTALVRGAIELSDSSILSWSTDQTLRRWDPHRASVAVKKAHDKDVVGILRLRDGSILSWGDNTLHRWKEDGNLLATFNGHTAYVSGVLELRDGSILSWSRDVDDCILRRWDMGGVLVATFNGHSGKISNVTELPDGSILSWSSDKNDTSLRRWRLSGELMVKLDGHTDDVRSIVKLTDGSILTLSNDTTLRRWRLDGSQLAIFEGHSGRVSNAIELSDGTILSWSGDETTLRRWRLDGSQLAIFEGHSGRVSGAIELSDQTILSWSSDKNDAMLRRWRPDGTLLATFEGHRSYLMRATELSNGSILSLSWDGIERCWDRSGNELDRLMRSTSREDIWEFAYSKGVNPFEFYKSGKATLFKPGMYVENGGNILDIFSGETGKTLHTFYTDAPIRALQTLGNGRLVIGDGVGRLLFLRWLPDEEIVQ